MFFLNLNPKLKLFDILNTLPTNVQIFSMSRDLLVEMQECIEQTKLCKTICLSDLRCNFECKNLFSFNFL